jgi:hypothetical protein
VKTLKIIGGIILGLGMVFFGLKILLRVYFRLHPTGFYDYRIKTEYKEPKNPTVLDFSYELPSGGCWSECNGKISAIKCSSYNPKYERCEFSCNGFLYNSCSHEITTTIIGLLTR